MLSRVTACVFLGLLKLVIGLERDRINSTQVSWNPEFAVFTALQRDTSRMRR